MVDDHIYPLVPEIFAEIPGFQGKVRVSVDLAVEVNNLAVAQVADRPALEDADFVILFRIQIDPSGYIVIRIQRMRAKRLRIRKEREEKEIVKASTAKAPNKSKSKAKKVK